MHRSRLRPWLTLALLALGLSACDKPDAAKTDDAKTKTDAKADAKSDAKAGGGCDAAHAKVLEQEISAQCALVPQMLEKDVPAAPWKPAPSAPPEAALQLDLGPQGLVLGGWSEPVPISELPGRFAGERERVSSAAVSNGRPSPQGWALAIEGATPRADVAITLQTLADAGLREGHLRLATQPVAALPMPRDPKRLAELAQLATSADPSQRAVLMAKEMEKTIGSCAALHEAFQDLAMAAPAQRCGLMSRSISEGLVSCGCANEAEVMTVLHGITVGLEPTPRIGAAVPVTLDPTAAPRAGATWAEVVAGLDETALAKLWVSPS